MQGEGSCVECRKEGTKGLLKVFSAGLVMWREWRMTERLNNLQRRRGLSIDAKGGT